MFNLFFKRTLPAHSAQKKGRPEAWLEHVFIYIYIYIYIFLFQLSTSKRGNKRWAANEVFSGGQACSHLRMFGRRRVVQRLSFVLKGAIGY